MLNIGPQELLLVLLIALIVVGPQRLPELSRQIGKGLREFRKVQDEMKGMVKLDLDDKPTPAGRTSSAPVVPAVHRTPRPAPAAPAEPSAAEGTGAETSPAPDPGVSRPPEPGSDG